MPEFPISFLSPKNTLSSAFDSFQLEGDMNERERDKILEEDKVKDEKKMKEGAEREEENY